MSSTSEAPAAVLLAGGRLLDPRQDKLGPVQDVLVADGRIAAAGTNLQAPSGTRRIDITGRTVMPGLIDAHVHVYMNELNIASLANVTQTYAAAKASFVLKDMLQRGWTTVRDVAGGDFGLRDASLAGYIETPRMYIGGKAISQTGGHGDFRRRSEQGADCACCTGLTLFSTLADGVPDVIKATREQLRLGADHIKIMLSGGVASPNDPLDSIQYRVDEIAACVEEAERWGAYVCAHAYSDVAIRRGVLNGVRSIEHGNFVGAETATMMAERGAFVVPTLIVYEATTVSALLRASHRTAWPRASACARKAWPRSGPTAQQACRSPMAPTCPCTRSTSRTKAWRCTRPSCPTPT